LINLLFLLLLFGHDAFMHHVLHALDASDTWYLLDVPGFVRTTFCVGGGSNITFRLLTKNS